MSESEEMRPTHSSLVDYLVKSDLLRSHRCIQAMASVDRRFFVPIEARPSAYIDSPLSIHFNATISAPSMHAIAVSYLEEHLCRPGARVLDVGSGSGYLTALFATLVGREGRVVGIEHIRELVEWSKENVAAAANQENRLTELLESGVVKLVTGDGREGYAPDAPYDAIHVGAAAIGSIPRALTDQLKCGGRLVLPLGQHATERWCQTFLLVDKDAQGHLHHHPTIDVRYVPLTSPEHQLYPFGESD